MVVSKQQNSCVIKMSKGVGKLAAEKSVLGDVTQRQERGGERLVLGSGLWTQVTEGDAPTPAPRLPLAQAPGQCKEWQELSCAGCLLGACVTTLGARFLFLFILRALCLYVEEPPFPCITEQRMGDRGSRGNRDEKRDPELL